MLGLIGPLYNTGLDGKNARVAFRSRPPLGVVFVHWVQYTFQVGSFQHLVVWSWWDCHQVIIAQACYVLILRPSEKKAFSCQIRLLHKGEHIWVGFKPLKMLNKQAVHTESLPVLGLIWPWYNTGQGGKKARVAIQSKPPLGLMFVHQVQYTWQVGSFQHLVFWPLWDCYEVVITLLPYVLFFSTSEKKAFSQ